MSITHTFLDAIPSIFLGAPDAGMEMSVLPGHKLLLEGRGYEAVFLTVVGSFFAVVICLILTPVLILLMRYGYPLIEPYITYILIFFSAILILREVKSRFWAFTVYMLSGLIGITTLTMPNLKQPLFPLLSGLFGISILSVSLLQKTKIPEQIITYPRLKLKEVLKYLGLGTLASLLVGTMPGLGSSQAAIISSSIKKNNKPQYFLILLGSINTIVMVMSFIALYVIDRARNGSVVVISEILGNFNFGYMVLFLIVSLFVAGIASFLTLRISRVFAKFMAKVNYNNLCIGVIILIIVLVFLFTGFLGLLVLTVSSLLGIFTSLIGIGKNHLMGCLLLPVILFFLL